MKYLFSRLFFVSMLFKYNFFIRFIFTYIYNFDRSSMTSNYFAFNIFPSAKFVFFFIVTVPTYFTMCPLLRNCHVNFLWYFVFSLLYSKLQSKVVYYYRPHWFSWRARGCSPRSRYGYAVSVHSVSNQLPHTWHILYIYTNEWFAHLFCRCVTLPSTV